MAWTDRQRQAIESRGSSLLVSAAAGSGKTSVLVERVKQLVLEEGVSLENMLIVTFTNAAASEMKERIYRGDARILPLKDQNRSACDWCSYRGICRIDRRIEGFGQMICEKRSTAEALEEMRRRMDGSGGNEEE